MSDCPSCNQKGLREFSKEMGGAGTILYFQVCDSCGFKNSSNVLNKIAKQPENKPIIITEPKRKSPTKTSKQKKKRYY